jgi:hypothetical protein
MRLVNLLGVVHLPLAFALAVPPCADGGKSTIWKTSSFKSLVAFGDSLTDGGPAEAILANEGQNLEPGTVVPRSSSTPNGGRSWTSYVTQYVADVVDGSLELYNYAIAGAVCNSEIVTMYALPVIKFSLAADH